MFVAAMVNATLAAVNAYLYFDRPNPYNFAAMFFCATLAIGCFTMVGID